MTTILNAPHPKTPTELIRSIASADYETLMLPDPPDLSDSLEVWEDALSDEPEEADRYRTAVNELGRVEAEQVYRDAYTAAHALAISGETR